MVSHYSFKFHSNTQSATWYLFSTFYFITFFKTKSYTFFAKSIVSLWRYVFVNINGENLWKSISKRCLFGFTSVEIMSRKCDLIHNLSLNLCWLKLLSRYSHKPFVFRVMSRGYLYWHYRWGVNSVQNSCTWVIYHKWRSWCNFLIPGLLIAQIASILFPKRADRTNKRDTVRAISSRVVICTKVVNGSLFDWFIKMISPLPRP